MTKDPLIINTAAKVALWERHGQTIMLAVITTVLAFSAKTLWDTNATQAKMTEQIASLTTQVSELRGAFSAMQQQYVTRSEFAVHEQRIQSLEISRK